MNIQKQIKKMIDSTIAWLDDPSTVEERSFMALCLQWDSELEELKQHAKNLNSMVQLRESIGEKEFQKMKRNP